MAKSPSKAKTASSGAPSGAPASTSAASPSAVVGGEAVEASSASSAAEVVQDPTPLKLNDGTLIELHYTHKVRHLKIDM